MRSSRASRIDTAVFIGLLTLASTFLVVGVTQAVRQRRILASSHPVLATVVGFDVEAHTTNGRNGGTSYRPVVRFQYEVDGTLRMGDQVGPLRETRGGHWAWRVLDRYQIGQHVTAWVRDDAIDDAYLEHVGSPRPYYLIGFGAAFVLFVSWLWWRRQAAPAQCPAGLRQDDRDCPSSDTSLSPASSDQVDASTAVTL